VTVGAKPTWRHQRSEFQTDKISLEESHPGLKGEKTLEVFPEKYWDVFQPLGENNIYRNGTRGSTVCAYHKKKGYKIVLSRYRTAAVGPALLRDQVSR